MWRHSQKCAQIQPQLDPYLLLLEKTKRHTLSFASQPRFPTEESSLATSTFSPPLTLQSTTISFPLTHIAHPRHHAQGHHQLSLLLNPVVTYGTLSHSQSLPIFSLGKLVSLYLLLNFCCVPRFFSLPSHSQGPKHSKVQQVSTSWWPTQLPLWWRSPCCTTGPYVNCQLHIFPQLSYRTHMQWTYLSPPPVLPPHPQPQWPNPWSHLLCPLSLISQSQPVTKSSYSPVYCLPSCPSFLLLPAALRIPSQMPSLLPDHLPPIHQPIPQTAARETFISKMHTWSGSTSISNPSTAPWRSSGLSPNILVKQTIPTVILPLPALQPAFPSLPQALLL